MGAVSILTAADGHELAAWRAEPPAKPQGGLVLLQEIFGVNKHIRTIADGFARHGYRVLAPSLFDRVKPGLDLGYDKAGIAAGRAARAKITRDMALLDIVAAVAALKGAGKVGVVGYCWGGDLAWMAASLSGVSASVVYYGAGIVDHLDLRPRTPLLMHFGSRDPWIPQSAIDRIRRAAPEATIHLYPAGHGFNCNDRPDFDAACAAQAQTRTLAFLLEHVG